MENSSETVDRDFLAPPSTAAGAGGSADPFRFDELQERLSLIEKSMDAPYPSTVIPMTASIPDPERTLEDLCRTMCSRGLAEHLCRTMGWSGLQKHLEPVVSVAPRIRRQKLSDAPSLREQLRAAADRLNLKHLEPLVSVVPRLRRRVESQKLSDVPELTGLKLPNPDLNQKHLEPVASVVPRLRRRVEPQKLSDVPELRAQLRAALKLAPYPSDLVYECSKYVKDGQAYVLLMELFLLMICNGEVEIAASTEQAAHDRARRWRDIYHACGGWDDDHRIEARAFLFFLASFGVPDDFPSDYVMNLIILSHPIEVSETLRRSRVLVPMFPGMIEKMLEHKLYAEAIDVALTFGVEDKFPVDPIVASFRAEYERASKELRTYPSVKELEKAGRELELRARSLSQALRDHKLYIDGVMGLGAATHNRVKVALSALKCNSNDDSGKRKQGGDEMETEQPSLALAHRLMITHARGKRHRTEPITCYLI